MLCKVRERVLEIFERHAVDAKVFTAVYPDKLSKEFRAKRGDVMWSLHKLNVEGLVHQPSGRMSTCALRLPEEPAEPWEPGDGMPELPKHATGCLPVWDERPDVRRPKYSKRLRMRIVRQGCHV